jgi:hypothetical protein
VDKLLRQKVVRSLKQQQHPIVLAAGATGDDRSKPLRRLMLV